MHPHTHNPFDTRPSGNPDTAKFLASLGDPQAAEAYRKAMGEEGGSPTTDTPALELTPEERARLRAAEARLQETREKKDLAALKAEYFAWAREFKLGGDDPEAWISDTFTFNPDGTVEVDSNLDLSHKKLTRLPRGLTRVNGYLDLTKNHLMSLEGLPQEIRGFLGLRSNLLSSLEGLPSKIYGYLDLSDNNLLTSIEGLPQEIHGFLGLDGVHITSLDELRGKKIHGDLLLRYVSEVKSIPNGIELGGSVRVAGYQTALRADVTAKGYQLGFDA